MSHSLTRRVALSGAAMLPFASAAKAAQQPLDLSPLPQGQARTVTLGVGGSEPDLIYLCTWLAEYGGYFEALKRDGITVNVVALGGGAEAILGLASGRTQINYQSFENAVRARAQGRDVSVVYNSLSSPAVYVLVRKGLADKVKSVSDTKGLRWGFTSFGSASHVVSLRVARYFGVDPHSISWTPVGGISGQIPALREARVDVLTATPPARIVLQHEGVSSDLLDLNVTETVRKIWGHDYLGLGLLTTDTFTKANPYVTYRIVDALHQSILACKSRPPAEIAAKLPAQFQGPYTEELIAAVAGALADDGSINARDAAGMIADLSDLKVTGGNIDLAAVVDNRFVEAIRTR